MAPAIHKSLSRDFHPDVMSTDNPFGNGKHHRWPASGRFDLNLELEEHTFDKPLPPIPQRMDGGLEAWLQVLGSWLLFINTWGLTNSYGTFQTYYSSEESPIPSYSSSSLAWIGSMQSFLTMFMGSLSGPLLDAGYLRAALVTGTCLEVFGLLATSFSTKLWQLFLFQGLTVGLGSGMLSTASLAIIPLYFQERKMTASGIAASGSAIGMSIYIKDSPKQFPSLIDTFRAAE